MACLDTTILIDLLRSNAERRGRALAKIKELANRGESIVTTRLNLAELYVGIERSDNPQRDGQRVLDVLKHLDGFLEFDDSAAKAFGQITAHLRRTGLPAGDMDVLIASTAMAKGHRLITRNAAHFANIPHLAIEVY
jgi:tRNA(fMet)-specific endonuclease VapC